MTGEQRASPSRRVRFAVVGVAMAGLALSLSASGLWQAAEPVRPISPLSIAMQREGMRLLAARDYAGATGYLESALVADPRNGGAQRGLGDAARLSGFPGRAIGHYRAAIALDPADRGALSGRAIALLQQGAPDLARRDLAALREACGAAGCPQLAAVQAAMAAAGERTVLQRAEILPQPVVEQGVAD